MRWHSPSPPPFSSVQLTLYVLLKKRASDTDRERPLVRNFAEQQAEFLETNAHRLYGNAENLGELSRDQVEDNLIVRLLECIRRSLERLGDMDPIRAPQCKSRVEFVDLENKRRSSSEALAPSLEN